MTPEEEAQNRALLDAYDPAAEGQALPPVKPGSYLDQQASGARTSPPPEPAPSAGPQVTQAKTLTQPEPAGPVYQPEGAGTVFLRSLGEALPGVVKAYGAYHTAHALRADSGGAGREAGLDELGREGAQSVAGVARTEEQRASALRAEQRQAWQDRNAARDRQNAETDRSRRMAREDIEDQFSVEARDPNSDKSKRLRDEIKTAFPQFAEAMPQFDSMSVYDFAHTPHPGLDKAKFDAQTDRLKDIQGTRNQGTMDVTRLKGTQAESLEDKRIAGRIKLKAAPKGGSRGGPATPADVSEYKQDLIDEYGGEDKIPPTILGALKAAASNPDPKQRATALRAVMTSGHGANVGAQKQANTETAAYAKSAEPAQATLDWARGVRRELKKAGIDPDHYQGQDIPGYGRLKSFVPDQALSAQGQRMRAAIEGEVAGLVLSMSGKQSSDQERAILHKVAGVMKGGAPENVIWGLHQLEGIAKAQLARAGASHTRGAAAVQGSAPIRVRTPDGKTHRFQGTADEAKQAGYEVL